MRVQFNGTIFVANSSSCKAIPLNLKQRSKLDDFSTGTTPNNIYSSFNNVIAVTFVCSMVTFFNSEITILLFLL